MQLKRHLLLPLATLALLAAAPMTHAADEVLATVNGTKITQQDYDVYLREHVKGGANANVNRQRVIDELVSRELVYQDALKQKLDKRKDVLEQLERIRHNLILAAAIDEANKRKPISDDELKALYQEQLKKFNVQEYKARHILLKEKSEAEKVITELDLGGNFAELAKKYSTGPTAKDGGDLGWFAPQQMVPEFGQAVVQLEKGKYTKAPVQTKFGWHVIMLEDTRSAEPPTFEQVKGNLTNLVQQRRLNEYIESLRGKADIKIK